MLLGRRVLVQVDNLHCRVPGGPASFARLLWGREKGSLTLFSRLRCPVLGDRITL